MLLFIWLFTLLPFAFLLFTLSFTLVDYITFYVVYLLLFIVILLLRTRKNVNIANTAEQKSDG